MPEIASTESISSNNSISRRQEHNIVKELHDILNKFLSLLIGVVLLMRSDSGNAMFQEYNPAMMGVVSATALLFLLGILVTLLQKHLKNFLPITILLLLQSVVCVLCLSAISLAISVIALALWLCVFGLIAFPSFQSTVNWFHKGSRAGLWVTSHKAHGCRQRVRATRGHRPRRQSRLPPKLCLLN